MYCLESRFTVSRPVCLFVGMLSKSRLNIRYREEDRGFYQRWCVFSPTRDQSIEETFFLRKAREGVIISREGGGKDVSLEQGFWEDLFYQRRGEMSIFLPDRVKGGGGYN